LSRISVMSDEVIGYKSPVIEVSSSVTADFHILLCGKVSDILGKLRDGTEVVPVVVKSVSITGNRWSDTERRTLNRTTLLKMVGDCVEKCEIGASLRNSSLGKDVNLFIIKLSDKTRIQDLCMSIGVMKDYR
jgi:hypothetical protein